MNMTNQQYRNLAEKHLPRSRGRRNMLRAFVTGGGICMLGQLISDIYAAAGLESAQAATACSVSLIFLGAALTGLGVYDKLARFAGAGTLVPITGFANSMAAAALEYKTEGFITGVGAKMFSIAGPVIVYGLSSSVVYGLLCCLTV